MARSIWKLDYKEPGQLQMYQKLFDQQQQKHADCILNIGSKT